MEVKFQKFQNVLSLIFGAHEVSFVKVDDVSFCVRSQKTCMLCGVELVKLIELAHSLDLHFYVRSNMVDGMDCVEFIIY